MSSDRPGNPVGETAPAGLLDALPELLGLLSGKNDTIPVAGILNILKERQAELGYEFMALRNDESLLELLDVDQRAELAREPPDGRAAITWRGSNAPFATILACEGPAVWDRAEAGWTLSPNVVLSTGLGQEDLAQVIGAKTGLPSDVVDGFRRACEGRFLDRLRGSTGPEAGSDECLVRVFSAFSRHLLERASDKDGPVEQEPWVDLFLRVLADFWSAAPRYELLLGLAKWRDRSGLAEWARFTEVWDRSLGTLGPVVADAALAFLEPAVRSLARETPADPAGLLSGAEDLRTTISAIVDVEGFDYDNRLADLIAADQAIVISVEGPPGAGEILAPAVACEGTVRLPALLCLIFGKLKWPPYLESFKRKLDTLRDHDGFEPLHARGQDILRSLDTSLQISSGAGRAGGGSPTVRQAELLELLRDFLDTFEERLDHAARQHPRAAVPLPPKALVHLAESLNGLLVAIAEECEGMEIIRYESVPDLLGGEEAGGDADTSVRPLGTFEDPLGELFPSQCVHLHGFRHGGVVVPARPTYNIMVRNAAWSCCDRFLERLCRVSQKAAESLLRLREKLKEWFHRSCNILTPLLARRLLEEVLAEADGALQDVLRAGRPEEPEELPDLLSECYVAIERELHSKCRGMEAKAFADKRGLTPWIELIDRHETTLPSSTASACLRELQWDCDDLLQVDAPICVDLAKPGFLFIPDQGMPWCVPPRAKCRFRMPPALRELFADLWKDSDDFRDWSSRQIPELGECLERAFGRLDYFSLKLVDREKLRLISHLMAGTRNQQLSLSEPVQAALERIARFLQRDPQAVEDLKGLIDFDMVAVPQGRLAEPPDRGELNSVFSLKHAMGEVIEEDSRPGIIVEDEFLVVPRVVVSAGPHPLQKARELASFLSGAFAAPWAAFEEAARERASRASGASAEQTQAADKKLYQAAWSLMEAWQTEIKQQELDSELFQASRRRFNTVVERVAEYADWELIRELSGRAAEERSGSFRMDDRFGIDESLRGTETRVAPDSIFNGFRAAGQEPFKMTGRLMRAVHPIEGTLRKLLRGAAERAGAEGNWQEELQQAFDRFFEEPGTESELTAIASAVALSEQMIDDPSHLAAALADLAQCVPGARTIVPRDEIRPEHRELWAAAPERGLEVTPQYDPEVPPGHVIRVRRYPIIFREEGTDRFFKDGDLDWSVGPRPAIAEFLERFSNEVFKQEIREPDSYLNPIYRKAADPAAAEKRAFEKASGQLLSDWDAEYWVETAEVLASQWRNPEWGQIKSWGSAFDKLAGKWPQRRLMFLPQCTHLENGFTEALDPEHYEVSLHFLPEATTAGPARVTRVGFVAGDAAPARARVVLEAKAPETVRRILQLERFIERRPDGPSPQDCIAETEFSRARLNEQLAQIVFDCWSGGRLSEDAADRRFEAEWAFLEDWLEGNTKFRCVSPRKMRQTEVEFPESIALAAGRFQIGTKPGELVVSGLGWLKMEPGGPRVLERAEGFLSRGEPPPLYPLLREIREYDLAAQQDLIPVPPDDEWWQQLRGLFDQGLTHWTQETAIVDQLRTLLDIYQQVYQAVGHDSVNKPPLLTKILDGIEAKVARVRTWVPSTGSKPRDNHLKIFVERGSRHDPIKKVLCPSLEIIAEGRQLAFLPARVYC